MYEMRKAEQRRTGQKSPSDRPSAQPGRTSGAPASVKPGDSGSSSRFGKWFKR
ncbi:MAG: hypothetical protein WDO74_34100 [Pseudomonadota bacterium]